MIEGGIGWNCNSVLHVILSPANLGWLDRLDLSRASCLLPGQPAWDRRTFFASLSARPQATYEHATVASYLGVQTLHHCSRPQGYSKCDVLHCQNTQLKKTLNDWDHVFKP
jgi:hypothetical protein